MLRRALGPAALFATLSVIGCGEAAAPRLDVVGGRTTVIGPEPGFDPAAPPPDWFGGPGAGRAFALVERGGIAALEVRQADTVIGRRLAAPLLVFPYLRWGWRLEPPATDVGVRLVVGLVRGAERALSARTPPPQDRRIELALVAHVGGGARVTASRGDDQPLLLREVAAAAVDGWMLETIDLSELHARLWPGESPAELVVSFVAVGGVGQRSDGRAHGQVAEATLSR